jgi:DNA repair exonuclease SbcCD ATPase subunit
MCSAIPETDRISEAGAKGRLAAAQAEASDSAETHRQAVLRHDDLVNRENRREALTREHRDAAERHRLLKKLGDLLGDTGLQLELVRDAEEQIVAFANETLQHLSDGDLSLEEDTAPDTNRTFDLRVRRSGGEPIGVAFLSGSQRFRVAVAIALAVGRFASGRTRALESVIIDEGFGSLDPEGLQAMATELKRLQQTRSLQRVILVSHQPDFTEQFSVGYTLSAGENGTMVSAFRR